MVALIVVVQQVWLPPWTLYNLSLVCSSLSLTCKTFLHLFFSSVSIPSLSSLSTRLHSHKLEVIVPSLERVAAMARSPKRKEVVHYLESRGWVRYICSLFNRSKEYDIILNILRILKPILRTRFYDGSDLKALNVGPIFFLIVHKFLSMLSSHPYELKIEALKILPYFVDKQSGNQDILRVNEGIEILLSILTERNSTADYYALHSISCLVTYKPLDEVLDRLVKANNRAFFTLIIQQLQKQHKWVAAEIISKVCNNNEYCQKKFFKAGVVPQLAKLLYSPDPHVRQYVCIAFHSLCFNNNRKIQREVQHYIPQFIILTRQPSFDAFYAAQVILCFSDHRHLHEDAIKSMINLVYIEKFAPMVLGGINIIFDHHIVKTPIRESIIQHIAPILSDPQLSSNQPLIAKLNWYITGGLSMA